MSNEEILVPELGESVLEATVYQWFKEEGDKVSIGDVLVELETDKVNLEVGAEQAGVLARIDHKAGEDVKVGEVLGIIEPKPEGTGEGAQPPESKSSKSTENIPQVKKEEEKKKPQTTSTEKQAKEAEATPLAKRVAEDQQVDIKKISGSGIGGRVTKEDVQRHLEKRDSSQAKAQKAPQAEMQIEKSLQQRERIKMSRRRRTIAKHMVEAQQTAAILSTFNEIDMSMIMDIRKRRNPDFQEKHGIKLGITSFFIKASIAALKDYPRLNAEIDGDEIILKHHYDIGVAIGDEEGLVVPVIREADRLSFAEIEERIDQYVTAVREKSLLIEDLRGGTFSITNGGVFGSLLSTPILNPPQVGILGLHKIEQRPVAVNGKVEIKPMMYVALSYDHRIVDGREAVQFLVRVKDLIEDPEQLMLAG